MAEFDKQPGGDRPSPAKAAFAMDEDVRAGTQQSPKLFPCDHPLRLEAGVGGADIAKGQVMPFHVPAPHLWPERGDAQIGKFMVLDQGHDRRGIPGGDHVEVGRQVPVPGATGGVSLGLAGREGHADLAQPRTARDRGDLKRVGTGWFWD